MLIIYCAKDKQAEALDEINVGDQQYDFRSPNHSGIVRFASRVVVVGSHPSIEERYKGIAKVETLTLDEDTDVSE